MEQNTSPHILVIDDDELIRSLVKEILSRNNYQVDEAENGKVGLQKCKSRDYDLIITDIVMPEMEGISLIQKLNEFHPGIPVIAMTGNAHGRMDEFLELSQQLGANAVLAKPLHKDELVSTVTSLLESSVQSDA